MGARRELLFGAKAGRRAMRDQLAALGLTQPVGRAEEASARLRPLAEGEILSFTDRFTLRPSP